MGPVAKSDTWKSATWRLLYPGKEDVIGGIGLDKKVQA